MRDVFISYKSNDPRLGNNDGTIANMLCDLLEASGITCWIAPRDIDLGTKGYARSIMEGIENCKVFLLVFSSYANESEYVASEIDAAFAAQKDIIPFCLDKTRPNRELRFYLGRKQWVYAEGDYQDSFHEIVDALLHKLGKDVETREPQDKHLIEGDSLSEQSLAIQSFSLNGVSFNMISVEGGSFIMGATPEQGEDVRDNEIPAHKVTLSSFYLGETPVTQALWQTVMGTNPSKNREDLRHPVDNVSWDDCQKFIVRLNKMTGKTFHLPTEAQWEYAARGGGKSQGYKYAGNNDLDLVAWYAENRNFDSSPKKPNVSNDLQLYDLLNKVTNKRFQMPGEENWRHITKKSGEDEALKDKSKLEFGENNAVTTHIVAGRLPNELGLYDMSGNVFEWCQDVYELYTADDQENPTGPEIGTVRIARGGSYNSNAICCRVSYRCPEDFRTCSNNIGLRLAL